MRGGFPLLQIFPNTPPSSPVFAVEHHFYGGHRTTDAQRLGSTNSLITDPDAEFSALVERQSRFVFRVAYAVLLNAHDAEDAVQETFLKLYRNHGWMQARNERAFLARTAWRVAVDLRAKRKPFAEVIDTEAEGAAHQLCGLELSPEQSALLHDRHARVHALIDALPEDLRVPLVLSATEEMNSRAIAEALSIPEGTVRTRLMRARQLLREKLTAREEAHRV